jgi:ABC-2 type transport system permease protein
MKTMPIFDQGYQHWDGPLSSHGWRWLAIARHGVRVQTRNRALRILLLLAWLPALALVVAVAVWGLVEQKNAGIMPFARLFLPPVVLQDPITFRTTVWTIFYYFFFRAQVFYIMLLVVVAGPGLISRDLRFNALPLYFARPLTRLDYFLGKLGVIGALVGAVAVGPAVIAYVTGVCFSLDLSVVKDTFPLLLCSVLLGLVITVSAGTLILAMSSLTARSLYVGIAWAGLWIVSSSVGTLLTNIHRQAVMRDLQQDNLARWLAANPPPAGVQMRGNSPVFERRGQIRQFKAGDDQRDLQQMETDRWVLAYREASQTAWAEAHFKESEAMRDDWRPLCSYVTNLNRMADALLGTDKAWVELGTAILRAPETGGMAGDGRGPRRTPQEVPAPPEGSERLVADRMVAQYPWWWSAAVLAGLVGISTWTMTRRVKSLDRLK